MTNENRDPRWRWDDARELSKLRNDHESAYREFSDFKVGISRQLDRMENDLRAVLPIPRQVEELTKALDRLSEKLESAVVQGGQGRRADWTMAIMVISLVAMVIFSLVKAGGH